MYALLSLVSACFAVEATMAPHQIYPVMTGLGPLMEGGGNGTLVSHATALSLPKEFDSRAAWPGCIGAVRDQGPCESCWAFAATEVLADRFCIASKGAINVTLSPQDLLDCKWPDLGCAVGSLPQWAFGFLQRTGVGLDSCRPYTAPNASSYCHKACDDGTPKQKYLAANYQHLGSYLEPHTAVNGMMKALIDDGPIDVTFNVYTDFKEHWINKSDSVYNCSSASIESFKGLHSVKVVGWGDRDGVPYWLIQNSWGPSGGIPSDLGFVRVKRGENQCGIETLAFAVQPAMPAVTETLV